MIQIEELSNSNYKDIAKLAFKLWPDSSLNEETQFFNECLLNSTQTAFLLSEDNRPIGFAYAALRNDYVESTSTKPVCYLEGIYIEPENRRFGYASDLVMEVEKWGKSNGCKEMASDAEIKNLKSIEFHKRVGFKEVNRIVCFTKNID